MSLDDARTLQLLDLQMTGTSSRCAKVQGWRPDIAAEVVRAAVHSCIIPDFKMLKESWPASMQSRCNAQCVLHSLIHPSVDLQALLLWPMQRMSLLILLFTPSRPASSPDIQARRIKHALQAGSSHQSTVNGLHDCGCFVDATLGARYHATVTVLLPLYIYFDRCLRRLRFSRLILFFFHLARMVAIS